VYNVTVVDIKEGRNVQSRGRKLRPFYNVTHLRPRGRKGGGKEKKKGNEATPPQTGSCENARKNDQGKARRRVEGGEKGFSPFVQTSGGVTREKGTEELSPPKHKQGGWSYTNASRETPHPR